MKEVTDPALLEMLDKKEVTDPSLIAQLEGETTASVSNSPSSFPKPKVLRTLAQASELINAPVVGTAKYIYKNLVPDAAQEYLADRTKTVVSGFSDAPPIREGATSLSDLYKRSEKYAPELTRAAGQSLSDIVNVAGTIPAIKGASGLRDLGKRGMALLRNPESIAPAIREDVEKGFQKGVKPTIVGKSDSALTTKFYDNAAAVTEDLAKRYPDSVPTTTAGATEKFSQLIHRAKGDIYAQYDKMAVDAGQQGAIVSIKPLRDDLAQVVKSSNVRKSVKDAAQKMIDEIASFDELITPKQAEDLIASFNSDTRNFWKKPDWNKLNDQLFTERTANILRNLTDESITKYRGPGWQELRKLHGSYSAVEKGVTDRANVVARQNVKGFFDLAETFATGDFIAGLATFNPAMIVRGATMKGASLWEKYLNSSDRHVKNMFQGVKKELAKETTSPPSLGEYLGYDEAMPVTPFLGGGDTRVSANLPALVGKPYGPAPMTRPEALRAVDSAAFKDELRNKWMRGPQAFAGDVPKVDLGTINPRLASEVDRFFARGGSNPLVSRMPTLSELSRQYTPFRFYGGQ